MSISRILACFLTIISILATGCGQGGSTSTLSPGSDPQSLFAEWKALVDNPEANMNTNRYIELAAQMSMTAPEMLNKIVDVIADPATKPETRAMALGSLNGFVKKDMVPRLLQLTDASLESSTRAGVIILLSPVQLPECEARFRELVNDPDKRVKFAANVALAERGDAEARKVIQAEYFEPNIPAQYKERIAFTLAQTPQPGDQKVLAEAAAESAFSPMCRAMAISSLVNLGDPSVIPSLEKCLVSEGPQEVKDLARDALAALKNQDGDASSASPQPSDTTPAATAETPPAAAEPTPSAAPVPAPEAPASAEPAAAPQPASGA
ncbi:MAG: HEAT repeat domain-containing protein [Candidatus Hydrogenedentes bacterium]|nr:HEAT repeat domain-containing protein [Candidatus Hydrogenedentota bacterium]